MPDKNNIISLPPLDYLQQHRRGSLTDPSLHVSAPRPAANYVFGDSGSESSSKQMRKILRSPSFDRDLDHSKHSSRQNGLPSASSLSLPRTFPTSRPGNISRDPITLDSPRTAPRQHDDSDDSSRRHSIANSSDSHLPHGTKRKMSADRDPPAADDIDSHLTGPGVPSPMNIDTDARAQKRRGSAIDTHRLAHLSIYDHRRHSVHAGAMISGPGMSGAPLPNSGQWWLHDRRDSLPAILPNTSSGYSAFSADQPHGRSQAPTSSGSMATFAWSAAQHPDGHQDPNIQNTNRPFESQPLPPTMIPPIAFPPDRRMSVPENIPPAVGPTRNVRSRSRPPSRQLRDPILLTPPAPPSAAPADDSSVSLPSTSSLKLAKETGSTPYSRSPELRVSHKLAERKRRKEMKDLFDELRDQLPADRGMKASKWEILSKAIDFVINLKQSHQDMAREIDMLRHELDSLRQGMPPFGPGGPPHSIVYSQGPVPYPPPPQPHSSQSRPSSSENAYSSSTQSSHPPSSTAVTNGSIPTTRVEAPPT
ncbi:hypothetical protein L210DRAFT_3639767 [Boletus edulis BED1]|uniref:BHLH domain-containing protein n=1 Tax=Boletus edulis BED1 TaxID=1328754 RepID=A0AAD4C6J6_BOLED|nr:hypothetical protein L210DRAFT_3639767 [Boletus edulis BED1]